MRVSVAIGGHLRGNIVGYVALFVALAGTAVAADGPAPGKNSVGSSDIINSEVRSVDIGLSQVRSSDVALDSSAAALTGANIAADTLSGADIDDSSLFNDGSLNQADIDQSSLTEIDAETVDGASICGGVSRLIPSNGQSTQATICTSGDNGGFGFGTTSLVLTCDATVAGQVTATVTLDTDEDDSYYADSSGALDQVFNAGEAPKTVATSIDGTSNSDGAASPMVTFVAAAPQVGGSLANFGAFSGAMAGSVAVHTFENFSGNGNGQCTAFLGLTA